MSLHERNDILDEKLGRRISEEFLKLNTFSFMKIYLFLILHIFLYTNVNGANEPKLETSDIKSNTTLSFISCMALLRY